MIRDPSTIFQNPYTAKEKKTSTKFISKQIFQANEVSEFKIFF